MEDKFTFTVIWSEKDNEYVGICKEFPFMSYLDSHPRGALIGIKKIVEDMKRIEEIQSER